MHETGGAGTRDGRKGLHEAVGEEVKLHGCIVAESAKVSTLHWRLLQPEIRRTSKDKRGSMSRG